METKNENTFVVFRSVHPGESLGDWLDDAGIKHKDFANAINIPESRLSELINGKRPMTEDLAERIASVLGGVDASYWMRAQANYEYNERMLALRNDEQKKTDAQEGTLRSIFNLKELYKHLGITAVSSIQRTQELFSKLGATYEDMTNRTAIVGCFKHSDTLRIDEQNMRTWVLLAQYEATQKHVDGEYSIKGAETAAIEIAQKANNGTLKENEIISILSQHGIAYAIVPRLQGCPVDAYSVMINGRPAIIVTHRHNNMQKLIFDVLHEIGHITKHMTGHRRDFIKTDYSQDNPQEKEANAYARDMLIPPKIWSEIIKVSIQTAREGIICRQIGLRAMTFGIDPCIAVARYKHDSKEYRGRAYAPTKII
jgi:HTH-type transcriptional regulator/antitoxin HigA